MGLAVEDARATFPLKVRGTSDLIPIVYDLPVPSAQVKSAILLAGMHAPGRTTITETLPSRDHTERMLGHFGAELIAEDNATGGRTVTICGDAELHGAAITVPGDPSSAAFITAAGLIRAGFRPRHRGRADEPDPQGFDDTLREMGADIELLQLRHEGGEPTADLRVRASVLRGVVVPPERAPSMIDEYPMLACLAAFAEGETRMEGLSELKVKESDRLAATVAGLRVCGVEAQAEGDDLIVQGSGGVRGGGVVETHMDHRIAMAFLTLGLGAEKPVTVDDTAMIATSFPGFASLMTRLWSQDQLEADEHHDHRHRRTGGVWQGYAGKRIAAHFGLAHLDTGTLYRAVPREPWRVAPTRPMLVRQPPWPEPSIPPLLTIRPARPTPRRDRIGGCPASGGA